MARRALSQWGVKRAVLSPLWDMNCNAATILVTGPNRAARAFLSDNLAADGNHVQVAATSQAAWQILCAVGVDLLVIDLSDFGAFDREGLDLISRVRESSRLGVRIDATMPVLVLAPRIAEVERLRVFERGGDDLVVHPYSYPELRARLGALLRRARKSWSAVRVRVGPLELDAVSRQAWLEARPVPLSAKEFALLAMLASEPSRVFSRRELLSRVWGFDGDDRTRTVDVHASRLRRKLAHPAEQFVVNAWGQGYKLVTAVSGAESLPATSAVQTLGSTEPSLSLVQASARAA
jgi:DNA-binding response OmpR family regulator